MQENQMFKRSAEFQDTFKISKFCISHCNTFNKSNITVHDSKCLENCGYNRAFLGAHFKEILDGTLKNAMESFPQHED